MSGFIQFVRTQGVIGLAIGFIIGKAVSDLVASLVSDIINPVIGIGLGRFGDLASTTLTVGNAHIGYGRFISILINFIIVAAVVYFGFKSLKLEKLDLPKK